MGKTMKTSEQEKKFSRKFSRINKTWQKNFSKFKSCVTKSTRKEKKD